MLRTLILFAFLYSTVTSLAQGTLFTYQGRLNDNGQPANGTYDLRFKLYDSTNQSANVIGPVEFPGMRVTNGLFTVNLDFGNVYNGAPLWLEIVVRTNGAPQFVALTPRQPLSSVPYAMFAGASTNLLGPLSAENMAPLTSLITSNSNGLYSAISAASIASLASPTNAGSITTNEFAKLNSFPNAFDVIAPLPPVMVNTWWFATTGGGGDATTTNTMRTFATNGILAMAQKYNTPFYYVIDDFWMSRTNVPNGILQPDPQLFPNGMKVMADTAHALGLKFGLYPQSAGWGIFPTNLYGNATNFLAWGIDYLKFELGSQEGPVKDQYLIDTLLYPFWTNGHPVFVESGCNAWSPAFTGIVQSPRAVIYGDVIDFYPLMGMVDYARTISPFTVGPGRGFFPSIEYVSHNLTHNEQREHWTAMAMIPSVWAFSFSTNEMPAVLADITNEDVFSINQDPLVSPGFLVSSNNYVNVYERRCVSNTIAVSIENRYISPTNYTLWFTNLPGASTTSLIRDCWAHTNCIATDSFTIQVNARSAALLRFTPAPSPPFTSILAINWPGSMVTSTTSNGIQTINYGPLDADVRSYIARSGITNNPTEMLAAASAVSLGKQHGWWTNWDALYLFRGATPNSTAQNLVSTNYNIVWHTNGMTFDWSGVTGDGTNSYGDTQFNPSTAIGRRFTTNSASFFIYNRTPFPSPGNFNNAYIGINASPKAGLYSNTPDHCFGFYGMNSPAEFEALNVTVEGDSGDFSGYLLANRYASNAQTIFHNQITGNFIDSSPPTGLPNGNFYIFGANSGGNMNSPSACNLALAGFGGGMTAAQWLVFQNDMRTVMSILGL